MSTERKSGKWIQDSVLKGIGHDLMMALGCSDYHSLRFHEAEQIADGSLNPEEILQ